MRSVLHKELAPAMKIFFVQFFHVFFPHSCSKRKENVKENLMSGWGEFVEIVRGIQQEYAEI